MKVTKKMPPSGHSKWLKQTRRLTPQIAISRHLIYDSQITYNHFDCLTIIVVKLLLNSNSPIGPT
nr:hypothetical protein SYMBAF_50473 [Serratia symbiotica]